MELTLQAKQLHRECDSWVEIGPGVVQFSTATDVGLYFEPSVNFRLPAHVRHLDGIYRGDNAFFKAVAAYHIQLDPNYRVFDEEMVSNALTITIHGRLPVPSAFSTWLRQLDERFNWRLSEYREAMIMGFLMLLMSVNIG